MTLHPKDEDWADPAFNSPENKILAPKRSMIVAYPKIKRYEYFMPTGEMKLIDKADFDEWWDELELIRSDENADYYRFK